MREKPGMLSEVMYVPASTRRVLIFLLSSHLMAGVSSGTSLGIALTFVGDPSKLKLRDRAEVVDEQDDLV